MRPATGPLRDTDEGAVMTVHVQPQAQQTEYVGRHGDAFKFRVAAAPSEGKANEALCAHLARRFGMPRRAVEIRTGHATRRKQVLLKGLTTAHVLSTLQSAT